MGKGGFSDATFYKWRANTPTGRSARRDRSTRPRTAGNAGRRRPSGLDAAVELRLGEKRAGQLQNLIGFAQLAHLAFEILDALGLGSRDAFALAGIDFVLLHLGMQRLGHAADLGSDGLDSGPLRGMLVSVLEHHARGATNLG